MRKRKYFHLIILVVFTLFCTEGAAAHSGWIKLTSTQPVTGLEIFGNSTGIAGLMAVSSPGMDLSFSHFASSQNWGTGIAIANPDDTQANVTLRAYNQAGNQMGVPEIFEIPAGGQATPKCVRNMFGGITGSGWIRLTASNPVVAIAIVRGSTGSIAGLTATGPEVSSAPATELYFPHFASSQDWWTGIAIANPSSSTADVTLIAYDTKGDQIGTTAQFSISAGGQAPPQIVAQLFNLHQAEVISVPGDYPTIQEGIDAAELGDTVQVAAGTYTETINMKEGVTIQGAGADVTIIKGGDGVMAADIIDGKLDGFTIRDSNLTGIHCYTTSVTFSNNVIINSNHSGIGCFDNLANPRIINNAIIGNGCAGIVCYGSGSPTIMNNIIGGNEDGLSLEHSSSASIINNIIIKNGDGIECEDYSYPTIMNNIVAHNCVGIVIDNYARANISYNNVCGNGENYENIASPGAGDISTDPLFINPEAGNYQLQDGSSCVDAGHPAPGYNDFNFPPSKGTERNDIGAYGGPEAVVTTFTVPSISCPTVFEIWADSINLSPSMAEIYGGTILLDIGLEGCNISSATAQSPSGQVFILYDDGTHGDWEANDDEYEYMSTVSESEIEHGEWTFIIQTLDGQTLRDTDYMGDNNMPIPRPIGPANGGIISTATPTTFTWNPTPGAEEYEIIIWDRMPDWDRPSEGVVWECADETEEPQITVPEGILHKGATYYWLLTAQAEPDNEEWQASREMWSFTVQ